MFYEKLRESLIEKTGWRIQPIGEYFWMNPEIVIYCDSNNDSKIKYSISFEVNNISKKVKAIVAKKCDILPKLSHPVKRTFPIEETDDIDILVKKIVEIIPFNTREPIPRYNF